MALPWLTVRLDSFVLESGAPSVFASSDQVLRSFCGRCGTPIGYRQSDRPEELDLTIGSLDAPADFEPADHIWMEDAVSWDRPADSRPVFPRRRP
jgi:hypothetical protein